MRILRRGITEAILPNVFLLKREHERFAKWEKLLFWDEQNIIRDDFPARMPLSILLILFLLISSIVFLFQWSFYRVVATEAIPAREVITNTDVSSLNADQHYYLSRTYYFGDVTYTRTSNISRSDYESVQMGTSRDVLILPSNRDMVIGSIRELFFPLILSLAFFVLSFGLCLYFFYRCYRPVLMLPAKISAVEQGEKHTNSGVHAIYEISYELISPKTKKPLKGRTISSRQSAPTPEQLLAVLYVNDTDIIPL